MCFHSQKVVRKTIFIFRLISSRNLSKKYIWTLLRCRWTFSDNRNTCFSEDEARFCRKLKLLQLPFLLPRCVWLLGIGSANKIKSRKVPS